MNRSILIIILLLLINFSPFIRAFASQIFPEPQKIIYHLPGSKIKIDSTWMIVYDNLSPSPDAYPQGRNAYKFCAETLQRGLMDHGIKIDIMPVSDIEGSAMKNSLSDRRIFLGNPLLNPLIRLVFEAHQVDVSRLPFKPDDSRYPEAYILDISSDDEKNEGHSILIGARGAAGIYFGVRSLLQMIDKNGRIEAVKVIDYPDLKWRGVTVPIKDQQCGGKKINWNLDSKSIDCIMDKVNKYSAMKLNIILFNDKLLHALDKNNAQYFKALFEQCRLRFMTPIPSISSRLTALPIQGVPGKLNAINFQSIEGVSIREEAFRFDSNGLAIPLLGYHNILLNSDFESFSSNSPDITNFWRIKNLLGNGWVRIFDFNEGNLSNNSVYQGHSAMQLKIRNPGIARKMVLQPYVDKKMHAIPVIPGSYYELLLYARHNTKSKNMLIVEVTQCNSQGQSINNGTHFYQKFRLKKKWHQFRLPIFINLDCHSLKLKFFPNSYGLQIGEIYVDNVELRRMNGALINVINNSELKLTVRSSDGKNKYQEGVDYVVEKGLFYKKLEYDVDNIPKTKIKLTSKSAIKQCDIVKISYDCLLLRPAGEDSRRCPLSIETYRSYRNLFENFLKLNPRFINLNLDEYRGGYNRDSRCLKEKKSNAAIFAHLVNTLNDLLHENGSVEVVPGKKLKGLGRKDIRIFMWDDMVNFWHNGGGSRGEYYQVRYGGKPGSTYLAMPGATIKKDPYAHGSTEPFRKISTDVIMGVWWYKKDTRGIMKQSPYYYRKRGFEYVGCPWDNSKNIKKWASVLYKSNALGMIGTTWAGREKGVVNVAKCAWNCSGNL